MQGWDMVGRLWRFQNAVFDLASEAFATHGLHPKSLAVLLMIQHLRHPALIAKALSMPLPTLSHMLREFEEKGLLRREIDPEDRRRFVLSLTDTGQQTLDAGGNAINQVLAERMSQLEEADLQSIQRTLDLFDQWLPNPIMDQVQAGERARVGLDHAV